MTHRVTIVTGGCGFVGRNLIRGVLLERDEDLVIIDDLSSGRHPDEWLGLGSGDCIAEGVHIYEKPDTGKLYFLRRDLRHICASGLPGALRRAELGDIYHLAARVGGRLALENSQLLIAENLAIDSVFLRWVTDNAGPRTRVLYMSSSAVYPLPLQQRGVSRALCEFDTSTGIPDSADGIYGWVKLSGEYLCRVASFRYRLPVACVRPFSGYGPDQEAVYPVPAISARAVGREDPLRVWGSGAQQRDFVFITDLLEGMQHALARITDGSAVNIGTGRGVAMTEVATLAAKLVGYEPTIDADTRKPEGAGARVANIEYMSDLLHWTPTVSLKEGLQAVVHAIGSLVDTCHEVSLDGSDSLT